MAETNNIEHSHEHTHSYTHTHEHGHDGQEHEHEHVHTYTHSHEHSHEQGHEHDHVHEHDHEHSHDHAHSHLHHHDEQTMDLEKLAKLLGYMKDHNEHHAGEVTKMADSAKELGKPEVAELLASASKIYAEGNALLSEALKLL